MKNWYAALVIGGAVLLGGPAIAETDMAQWTQLDDEYRIAIRERLSQKPMEEWSFNDLQLMAASVSKDVYGANPQLLRAKMLTDLETLPLWKGPSPKTFHEKEMLEVSALTSLLNQEQIPWPLFYGKHPQQISAVMKMLLLTRTLDPKALGRWHLIRQLVPDRLYRLEDKAFTLILESYNEHLFVMDFELTEQGLLMPLVIRWLEPKASDLSRSTAGRNDV